MNKCSKEINPNCDYCGLTEDNLHLFIQCKRITKIWTHYQTTFTKLTGTRHTLQQHLLTLNVSHTNKNNTKLIITIIQVMLFKI